MEDAPCYAGPRQVVKVGEQLQLRILGAGSKGDFYGKHRNFVIFVKDLKRVAVGESIVVEVTEVKDKCAFSKKI